MWQTKHFKTLAAQNAWMEKYSATRQIVVIYVNNGYAVTWRRLRIVY